MADISFKSFPGLWIDSDQNLWIYTQENDNCFNLSQKNGPKSGNVFFFRIRNNSLFIFIFRDNLMKMDLDGLLLSIGIMVSYFE